MPPSDTTPVPLPASVDRPAPLEAAALAEPASPPEPAAPPEAADRPKAAVTMAIVREIIETVLLAVIMVALLNFATGRYRVQGDSMQPTMHPEEYVLIDKISYRWSAPQRGDIVVFEYPFSGSAERDFIKRLIGLPGETISIANGQVSVNGQPLEEPYIAAPPLTQGTWTLDADQYFVMGDNRNNSSDSRSWGPLEQQYLIGRALLVYWPPPAWSIVPHYQYASVSASN
jgi:signal peptidase I